MHLYLLLMIKRYTLFIAAYILAITCHAQVDTMRGICKDFVTEKPIANVIIHNIHSSEKIITTKDGQFAIPIKKDELVVFTHVAFDTVRIRIKDSKKPSYYVLDLKPKTTKLAGVVITEKVSNYSADSAKNYETYKVIFDKPNLDELPASTAIIARFDKKYQQQIQAREHIAKWQEEKYIDQQFSEKKLGAITGLKGDSLKTFITTYRPSYNMLRTLSAYELQLYIKLCLNEYCPTCVYTRRSKKVSN
jgi:hypothetical protein